MNEEGLSLNGLAKIQNQGAPFIMNPKPDILDHRKHASPYESKYGEDWEQHKLKIRST